MSEEPSAKRRSPTILVIEPHDGTRELWMTVLRNIGCRPTAVATALDAEWSVAQAPPDLVVTELVLPDAEPAHICRALRAQPSMKTRPILVVTAWSHRPDLAAAREAGADAILMKPLDVATFTRAVQKLLDR